MEEEKSVLPAPIENFGVGKFEIKNFDELKSSLTNALKKYETVEVSDEFYTEAKKARADLNKVSKSLDDRRKELKKRYLEPFEYGEKQIKELTEMIAVASGKIDSGIKAVEEAKKKTKESGIVVLFSSIENPHGVSLNAIWKDTWLNAGTSMKKIEEEIKAFLTKVDEENKTIETLFEDQKRAQAVKNFYSENGYNLTEAIKKEKELYDYVRKPAPTPVVAQADTNEDDTAKPVTPGIEEKIESINFRVYGTREELLALGNYIKEHGLKYETIGR